LIFEIAKKAFEDKNCVIPTKKKLLVLYILVRSFFQQNNILQRGIVLYVSIAQLVLIKTGQQVLLNFVPYKQSRGAIEGSKNLDISKPTDQGLFLYAIQL